MAVQDGRSGLFFPCDNRWSRHFGSLDSNLYAVDIKTGQEKWRFKTGDPVYSSPAITDGVVYFGSLDSNLYAVDIKTGQEKWRFKTENGIDSSPAVVDGAVFFASLDKNLYAVDIKTGQEKWRFKAKNGNFGPAIDNGVVYSAGLGSSLYAVDIKTGQEKWRFKTETLSWPSSRQYSMVSYISEVERYPKRGGLVRMAISMQLMPKQGRKNGGLKLVQSFLLQL